MSVVQGINVTMYKAVFVTCKDIKYNRCNDAEVLKRSTDVLKPIKSVMYYHDLHILDIFIVLMVEYVGRATK